MRFGACWRLGGKNLPPYQHRGALRGTPRSACLQHEPNATELSNCAPSQRAASFVKTAAAAVVAWRGGRAPPWSQRPSPAPRPVARPPQRPPPTLRRVLHAPRAASGAACVCLAWVPLLEDGAYHDEPAAHRPRPRPRRVNRGAMPRLTLALVAPFLCHYSKSICCMKSGAGGDDSALDDLSIPLERIRSTVRLG